MWRASLVERTAPSRAAADERALAVGLASPPGDASPPLAAPQGTRNVSSAGPGAPAATGALAPPILVGTNALALGPAAGAGAAAPSMAESQTAPLRTRGWARAGQAAQTEQAAQAGDAAPYVDALLRATDSPQDKLWRETVFALSHLETIAEEAQADYNGRSQLLYALFYDQPSAEMKPDAIMAAKALYLCFAGDAQGSAALRRLLDSIGRGDIWAMPGDYTLLRRLAGPRRLSQMPERYQPARALHNTVVARLRTAPHLDAMGRTFEAAWLHFDLPRLRVLHDLVRQLTPARRGPAPWAKGQPMLAAFTCWEPRWDRLEKAISALRYAESSEQVATYFAGARALLRRYLVLEGPAVDFACNAPELARAVQWQIDVHGLSPSLSQQLEAVLEANADLVGERLEFTVAGAHPLRFVLAHAQVDRVHAYLRAVHETLLRAEDALDEVALSRLRGSVQGPVLERLDAIGRLPTVDDEWRALGQGTDDDASGPSSPVDVEQQPYGRQDGQYAGAAVAK